jgi:hypothetical protein
MDCTEFRRLETEYVEGTLDAAVREEADRHIEQCEACKMDLAAYRASVKAVLCLADKEPPPGLWEAFPEYAGAREKAERVGAFGRVGMLIRGRFSEVCKGLIIFMNVTCETATRRLQKYVVEA